MVRGEWRYLYRAIDFLPTADRGLDTVKRFFHKMLSAAPLLVADSADTDGAGISPPTVAERRKEGLLPRMPLHCVTEHLQHRIESDHCRVKRRMPRVGGFRAFDTARRTVCGFEAMLCLRTGFRFAGAWTVRAQNLLLGVRVERQAVHDI